MNTENIINSYTGVSLSDMDQVKLMNRTDRKFWFNRNQLSDILKSLEQNYSVLEIEGKRMMSYESTYYDTLDDLMYYTHHRGKLNRYKIRRRNYMISGISFLEIKFKNNKGRTIKKRIPTQYEMPQFSEKDTQFIKEKSPYQPHLLKPSLINNFKRITLVNKNMHERCTIDLHLNYTYQGKKYLMDDLVVVEVKTEGLSAYSPMAHKLSEKRIKPSGFSKYCIGRSLVEPQLKSNNFKSKQRELKKKCHLSIHSK